MKEGFQKCSYCGKEFKHTHSCKVKELYEAKIKQDKKEDIPESKRIESPEFSDFPEVEKIVKPKEITTITKEVKTTKTEGGGELFGFAEFLLTAKDWINSFWDKEPYIRLSEKTAERLEKQFNKAFGIYIKPITGFLLSMFLIFGLPILIHAIGKELIMELWNKFQKGFKEKLKVKEEKNVMKVEKKKEKPVGV